MAKYEDIEVEVSDSLNLSSESGIRTVVLKIPFKHRRGAKGFTLVGKRDGDDGRVTAVVRVMR